MPSFVDYWLLDPSLHLFILDDEHAVLASSINVAAAVILAPIIEELLFRGLLLRTWIAKWGPGWAVAGAEIRPRKRNVCEIG